MAGIIDRLDMNESEVVLITNLGGVLHLSLQVGVVVSCHAIDLSVATDLHAYGHANTSDDSGGCDHECFQSMLLLESRHINPLASPSQQDKVRVSFTFAFSLD